MPKCQRSCCSNGCTCTCKDNLFHSWLSNTTIHGIVHVFTSKSPLRRIFWAVIFLSAAGGCLYNVVERFATYLDRPTSTTLSFKVNDGVRFPAITVCNLNPVSRSYLERVDRDDALFDLLLALYSPFEALSLLGVLANKTNATVLEQTLFLHCMELTANNVTELLVDQVFVESQMPLDDFIEDCTFIPTFESCKDSFEPVFTNLGLCYTLNINRTVRKSGVSHGLRLVLNILQNEYITPFFNTAGAKISVHPPEAFPEPDEQGIAVPPGKNAFIGLREERIIDRTSENDCRPADTRLEYFPGAEYSLSRCKANAVIKSLFNICSCRDPVGEPEFLVDQQLCRFSDICCMIKYLEYIELDDCVPACNTINYRKSVSYAQYPADVSADFTAYFSNSTPDAVLRDSVAINVFFEDIIVVVSTTVYSYSFSAFLSDLGGQLGLFLGASAISMLEFMSFLFDEVRRLCTWKKCNKLKQCIDASAGGVNRYVPKVVEADNNNIELSEHVAD